MTLLQPIYLWGLLGLAIPIAIHLWSRRKVKTIKVGSIQFINETKSKQSNSLQINEWVLLVLRCLVIGLLVLILTKPQMTTSPENREIVYIFEPSLLATAESRDRFKNISEENRLLLAPSFPIWEEDKVIKNYGVPDYWQLAMQLDQISADSIVIFSNAFLKGIKGKRPTVSKNVNWIAIDSDKDREQPIWAMSRRDSVTVFSAKSNDNYLAFAKAKKPKAETTTNNTGDSLQIKVDNQEVFIPYQKESKVEVLMVFDKKTAADTLYVKAALNAIASYSERDINIEMKEQLFFEDQVLKSDYIIWLSNAPLSETDTPTLIYRPDIIARKLIIPGAARYNAYLTQKLSPESVVRYNLVASLLQWMDLDKDIERQLLLNDRRKLDINQFKTQYNSDSNGKEKIVSASMIEPLWVLLLLFLIVERIIARFRKQ